ncbi:MAG: hypothetical protein AB8F94_12615 [Saprospiraceae bacterium]
MKNKIGLLLLIVFLFQGCIIHSLYPLYTAETIILDENIEGFWAVPSSKKNADCPEGLLFEKAKDKNFYYLTTCEDGVSSQFETHLVKIGKYTYLDMYPERDHPREKGKDNKVGLADFHLIATHSFARVTVNESKLTMESFKTEWLEDLFKQRKIRIKHEVIKDDEILLTASSKDLQKFVLKYEEEEKAYEDEDEYIKKTTKN